MFLGKYNKSVLLTYAGVCAALFGMFFALCDRMDYAFLCLISAGVCDLFDGKVARACKRTPEEMAFGVQIDSLADVVSFLALPSIIAMKLLNLWYIAVIPYALAGIIRLAWFNMHTTQERTPYFEGLPVTYAALILPLFYLLGLFLPAIFIAPVLTVIYLLIALLFVLSFKIPKPSGIWYVLFSLLAVIVAAGIVIL